MSKATKTKVTLGSIYQSSALWAKLIDMEKSPSIAFKIARHVKSVINEYIEIAGKEIEKLRAKYSTAEKDQPVSVNPEKDPVKAAAFENAVSDYMAGKVEITKIDITLDELVEDLGSFKGNGSKGLEFVLMGLEEHFIAQSDKKAAA